MDAAIRSTQLRVARLIPLWVIAAFAILVSVLPGDASADALPETYHPTAQRALRDNLTYQGQCWTWVRQIVFETTGRTMGFGYVSGFYEAGAVEVPLSEAVQGDIIQIADDQNAGPGVDYPGLHTALVLTRFEDGTFTIIDSNSKWDGIVRIRYDYDPVASANRFSGLEVHAYRIPLEGGDPPPQTPSPTSTTTATITSTATPTSTASSTVPPSQTATPEPTEIPEADRFNLGDKILVTTDGGCLNLRGAPTLAGQKLGCLAEGSSATVLSDVVHEDGWAWVAVQSEDGQAGWVASEYLSALTAGPPPPPEPETTETPSPGTSTPEPSPTPTPDQPPPLHRAVIPFLAVTR